MEDEQLIRIGWFACRLHGAHGVFLWLSELGWDKAAVMNATRLEDGNVRMHGSIKEAWLLTPWSLAN